MSLYESISNFVRAVKLLYDDPVIAQRMEKVGMLSKLEGTPLGVTVPEVDEVVFNLSVFISSVNTLCADVEYLKAENTNLTNRLRSMRTILLEYSLADTEEKRKAVISSIRYLAF